MIRKGTTTLIRRGLQLAFISVLLLGSNSAINAQTKKVTPATTLAESRSSLISAAEKHKTAAQELLLVQEAEVKKAQEKHEQLRQLVVDGLVARVELEQSERLLSALQAKLDATRQQIVDSDKVVADVRVAEQLAKTQGAAQPKSFVKPTVLRYGGSASWSLGNLGVVQAFFSSTFGRALPTSALGQSATHNRLGWDHRHAVDVPLHPDSTEGKALVGFLQSNGIPFLAFRGAVAGVSTGPHIHIGRPSHRL